MSALQQQMTQMMSMWDTVGGDDPLEQDLQRVEISRAVLALFVSGSGAYRTSLQQLFDLLFRVIDRFCEDRLKPLQPSTFVSNVAIVDLHSDPFDTLREQRARMDALVLDAGAQRDDLLKRISAVEEERNHVQMLLCHQMNKGQRQADGDSAVRVIRKAEAEKLADELTKEIAGHREEVSELRRQNSSLRELNSKYAAQALELSARLKVLTDHNHRLGSSLTLLRHDLISTERDCETAQHELDEARRSNRLLSDALDSRGSTDRRDSFVGRGTLAWTPRHLQCSEYVKHIPITKELASHLVFEILNARKAKGSPLAGFTSAFLASRYGADASSYAYALNLACEMFDADVSLQIFHAAANGLVSDEIYTMIQLDIKTFVDACASADIQLHGSARLCIPYAHAVGILVRMFPGYPQKVTEGLLDALDSALTNTGVLYYATLFPNTTRDELIGLGDDGKIAQDSRFSLLFKQCILDDVLLLLNRVEDRIGGIGKDIVTADDILERVSVLEFIGPKIEIPLQHYFDTALDPGSNVSVIRAAAAIRSAVLIRSGLTMTRTVSDQFFSRAKEDFKLLTGDDLAPVDYDALISQSRRPEFFVGKRSVIDGTLSR
ncbi:Hypothetical protein, putative [Bodo saltans]|uniref:Translin-associated factor X-interacting protein 1 N-terminal domain-containing protein n=1 Tax=Bodo saltans TaxID=75058 RepID=A0A0S4JII7_BODSA|nr:Hypothetical protein, putative [Bodo saltans]|eukprot:CUG88229.1 Hypothetical protein, putative [Bodo saltans]